MPEEKQFLITLGDFSGPLDLLCHLVESRAVDVASVKLTDVLSQYVSYALTTKKATLAELAEFFSLASGLLLRKVRSLLPRVNDIGDETTPPPGEDVSDEGEADEDELRILLERFMPYRAAALRLSELKEERERSFVRILDEGGPPWFDIGDLYGLSTLWWRLIDEKTRRGVSRRESGFMAEIPDAVPEEVLVEQRMGDVMKNLEDTGNSSLKGLLASFGEGGLIVTLLALLELSRLGRIRLAQSEMWEDVRIVAA
ncbi:MAG: segregation/condensation protein A [Synergistaceae bacterium]|jgi:segregation and condensation protein A|nr:segregation/condensation protein A [Synergistaceae bacterium]